MDKTVHWPFNSGEMAHQVRTHDWATTVLGPVKDWPAELKFAVTSALDNQFPTAVVWGPNLITIYNDGFRTILGNKMGTLGQSFSTIWAEAWDELRPITQKAFNGESSFIENYPLRVDRSGRLEQAFFTFSYSPIRGADGAVLGMVDTVVETTTWVEAHVDMRTSKVRLRESELRSRTLVNDIAQATWETNAEGVVHTDSSSWRDYTGQSVDEWVGYGWLDAIHPDDRPFAEQQWRAAVAAGRNVSAEFRLKAPDGGWRWTNVRAAPLCGSNGKIQKWIGMNIDIDARKRIEVALRYSEACYRAFVTASSDVVFRMSPDWSEMWQLEGHTFLPDTHEPSRTWLGRYIHVEDHAAVLLAIQEAIRTKSMFELEHRVIRVDGSLGWTQSRAVPILAQDSEISEWLGTARDTTAANDARQRQATADAALFRSEQRLREFGEASSDVLWTRDAKTLQWEYLTPAFEMVYGLSREQALSGDNLTNWAQLIVPEDRVHALESIQRVGQGERVTFQYRIRRPSDGQIRWLRDMDFPIYDATGQIHLIGGVGHDVTELKTIEAALESSELRLRTLVEGMPQLVWRVESTGQWTWASTQWTERTGQSEAASHDSGWLTPVHPEDREAALAAWKKAEDAGVYQVDTRIRDVRSGKYHWFQNRAKPIHGADGGVIEWLGTSTDIDAQVQAREYLINAGLEMERHVAERTAELSQALSNLHREVTEHSQAEERLRQSEKLKAVGQLTGGIAHDFNNMLQGITSALALIRIRSGQDRMEAAKTYIDIAEKAAGRAGALTHRLLAFSRQQTLMPEAVVLDRIAQGMEDMIRRAVGPSVQVETKLGDGHWLVLCDPNQMESALLNLCINARDAMPGGGWLTISTEERVLSAADVVAFDDLRPGRYAALAVTDNGTGMTAEIKARVFEPFFTTKPVGQGTGLGMSQIYGFMRQSGGLVQVETQENEGTTVRLCLPFHAMNPEEQMQAPRNGKTLLLVEDEHDIRRMLADELRELGYSVLQADTAEAALRVMSTGAQIDLLVTDFGLRGGVNGRELSASIREQTAGMPVIFITGFAGEESLSGETVLRKPFRTAGLVESIRELLV